jgi:hypothetical protein
MPKIPGEKLNGGRVSGAAVAPRQRQKSGPAEPKLEAKASAALCDQLLAEINNLTSGDDAAMWAHRRLIEKNKLTDADAHRVEEMFRARRRLAFRTPTRSCGLETEDISDAQTHPRWQHTGQSPSGVLRFAAIRPSISLRALR